MNCEEVFLILPERIRELLKEMQVDPEKLLELRIRAGRPVIAVCKDRELLSGQPVPASGVQETLAYLGNYSLYAYEEEIRRGFLTLPGGHRVGLAGKTVTEGNRIQALVEVSSLNIRFAREVKGCADRILPFLWEGDRLLHTLIASAPGQGKTTLLRDCIRQISDGTALHRGRNVGVVDERSELAGNFCGMPGNDLGLRTDILDGCPKAEGMLMLIRSMAPEVVAVDEIGNGRDLEAIRHARNCGCVLLATVHGTSFGELEQKPALGKLLHMKLFERYVFLEPGRKRGQIGRVLDQEGKDASGDKGSW